MNYSVPFEKMRKTMYNNVCTHNKKTPAIALIESEKVSLYKVTHGNSIVFDGGVFDIIL